MSKRGPKPVHPDARRSNARRVVAYPTASELASLDVIVGHDGDWSRSACLCRLVRDRAAAIERES